MSNPLFKNYSIRAVISGALDLLEGVSFYYANTDAGVVKKTIPYFFAFTGSSSRYMNKNYFRDAQPGDMINDSATLPVPRGVITLTGAGTNQESNTNSFTRVDHYIEDDGILKLANSEVKSVPITLRATVYLVYNSVNELIDSFEYFATSFSSSMRYTYEYNGIRVDCTIGTPADLNDIVPYEWDFTTERELKQEFEIEIKSYLLRIDEKTTRLAVNNMKSFIFGATPKDGQIVMPPKEEKLGGPDSPFNF